MTDILLRAIAFVLSLSCIGGCKHDSTDKEMTKDHIEKMISQEIHIGDTRDKVLSFLDTQKIEHSG